MPSLSSVWSFVRGLTAMLATTSGRLRGNQAQPTLRDPTKCWSGPLRWESVQGEVRVNNEPFHIKGTNWYGFETAVKAFHGLDQRSMDDYFEFMQANKFNALRIPFSLKFALDFDEPVDGPFVERDLEGKTGRELLNLVIEKAAKYNILVMLDLHRLNDQFIPQLWYSDEHPVDDVLKGWDTVLGATKKHWNVFAVDLKNEPFGVATWGDSHPATDWNKAAVDIAKHLLTTHSEWTGLVFVEGINYSTDFRGIKRHPLDFGSPEFNRRMVLSPHQYGPSVVMLPMFLNESFPANMPEVWHNHWGFVEEATGRAAVLGEWGGHYTGLDKIWQDAFSDYLIENCLSDQFQWDLNPDSGDTGGLVKDDWRTPEVDKLKVLDRVQPDPSYMVEGDHQVCLVAGSYANPDCNPRRPHKKDEDKALNGGSR